MYGFRLLVDVCDAARAPDVQSHFHRSTSWTVTEREIRTAHGCIREALTSRESYCGFLLKRLTPQIVSGSIKFLPRSVLLSYCPSGISPLGGYRSSKTDIYHRQVLGRRCWNSIAGERRLKCNGIFGHQCCGCLLGGQPMYAFNEIITLGES
jgi:hypothetical protein